MKTSFLLLITAIISFSFIIKKGKTKDIPKFNYIPAGSFHAFDTVVSAHAFFISTTEVTNKQFSLFIRENNSLTQNKIVEDDKPITNLTYEEALAYCKWLEEKINSKEITIKDLKGFEDDNLKIQVTLPSIVEWTSAAKSMVDSKYYWDKLTNINTDEQCNFRKLKSEEIIYINNTVKYKLKDDLHSSKSVSSFAPNDFGLYDMCGNVAEMTIDKGIAMGGSFLDGLSSCSTESYQKYSNAKNNIGFRPIITFLGGRKLLENSKINID